MRVPPPSGGGACPERLHQMGRCSKNRFTSC